ncbi:MAG: hypothetical protein AVDCRST_MAG23-738 [uncultured Sphingosinicella sp.]|uniref:Uncharacterized protein n=1 Tax=uncultured Sphingosinicella sp. TaxID=478748 RepID=A0A6J4TQ63_9SPHN|nr:MAG: hypothetical protein AVDCRST_MAG23-738 [uncultured Sphingosinicella sp.]
MASNLLFRMLSVDRYGSMVAWPAPVRCGQDEHRRAAELVDGLLATDHPGMILPVLGVA